MFAHLIIIKPNNTWLGGVNYKFKLIYGDGKSSEKWVYFHPELQLNGEVWYTIAISVLDTL